MRKLMCLTAILTVLAETNAAVLGESAAQILARYGKPFDTIEYDTSTNHLWQKPGAVVSIWLSAMGCVSASHTTLTNLNAQAAVSIRNEMSGISGWKKVSQEARDCTLWIGGNVVCRMNPSNVTVAYVTELPKLGRSETTNTSTLTVIGATVADMEKRYGAPEHQQTIEQVELRYWVRTNLNITAYFQSNRCFNISITPAIQRGVFDPDEQLAIAQKMCGTTNLAPVDIRLHQYTTPDKKTTVTLGKDSVDLSDPSAWAKCLEARKKAALKDL